MMGSGGVLTLLGPTLAHVGVLGGLRAEQSQRGQPVHRGDHVVSSFGADDLGGTVDRQEVHHGVLLG